MRWASRSVLVRCFYRAVWLVHVISRYCGGFRSPFAAEAYVVCRLPFGSNQIVQFSHVARRADAVCPNVSCKSLKCFIQRILRFPAKRNERQEGCVWAPPCSLLTKKNTSIIFWLFIHFFVDCSTSSPFSWEEWMMALLLTVNIFVQFWIHRTVHSVTLRRTCNASRNNNFAGMKSISLHEHVVFLLESSNILLCNVSIKNYGIQNAIHGALTRRVDVERSSMERPIGILEIKSICSRIKWYQGTFLLSVISGLASDFLAFITLAGGAMWESSWNGVLEAIMCWTRHK